MSRKRNDAFSEAVVGVFMLAVLSLLVYFTIVISGVDIINGRARTRANVTFTDVGGLKDHDNVMYRGTKVGTVERIVLLPNALNVIVEINKDVILRTGYRISVCDMSMLGGHYLLLEEGAGEPLPLETTAFTGESPVDLGRTITHAAHRLDEVFSDPRLTNIVEKVDSAMTDVATIAASVREGKGTIGKLLSADDKVYDDLKATVASAKETATNLSAVVQSVREGKGSVGKLLGDDGAVYDDLKNTLANASRISDKLNDIDVAAAVKSFRDACDSFNAKDTVESANALLDKLNSVADRLKNGEGTIGKLLANEELYNEVTGLAKDVRQIIDNYRDTTPISTFGSLIMGGL